MKELRARNDVLGDPAAVRAAIADCGYVFRRDVIDLEVLRHAKRGVMAWLSSQGAIEVRDDEPYWTGADVGQLGAYPQGLIETGMCEWLFLRHEVRQVFERIFGEPARVLPMGQYQFSWPGKPECWSQIHQDGRYTEGVEYVIGWIPLMDIDEALGGVAIVPRAQSDGSLHPDADFTTSNLLPFISMEALDPDAWHRADYRPGDLLLFGRWTPHCGMPNHSDRIRLSVDNRIQPRSALRPLTGIVTAEPPGRIVIVGDDGREHDLSFDEQTYVSRLPRSGLIGRRVLATTENGHALLVRYQHGFVPWDVEVYP
jgi:hypothetical protein